MTSPVTPLKAERPLLLRTVAVALAGLASLYFTKLALFAAVGAFIAWASLPRGAAHQLRRERWLLAVAAVTSGLGLMLFIAREAIPGIVQGGNRFTEQRVVSRLREILFAEDSARRLAKHDPDRDGIGSALLLGELTAQLPLRGGLRLPAPLLDSYPRQTQTAIGPAIEIGGYFLIVCVPKQSGGLTAQPGEAIDEELAERRFIAYAWPSGTAPGLNNAVALDEHERILMAPVNDGLRFGSTAPPSCNDAMAAETQSAWKPWRNKQARSTLPGDR